MPTFNPHLQPVLDDLLLAHPLVRAGKMFGYPAYYAGKKLCACLYEQGVGLKLPAAAVERLIRRWLQVNLVAFIVKQATIIYLLWYVQ